MLTTNLKRYTVQAVVITLCFFSDLAVTFTAIFTKDNPIVNESFQRLAFSPLVHTQQPVNIVVTPEMIALHKAVTSTRYSTVYMSGPPGLGKTTALYWLYQVLKDQSGFFPVALPWEKLDEYGVDIQTDISKCPEGDKLVLLVDLLSPSLNPCKLLITIFMKYPRSILVIALSSAYRLFVNTKPIMCTAIYQLLLTAKEIKFKKFDDDTANSFLSLLCGEKATSEEIKKMLENCNGIPQLLAFCCNGIDACNNALSSIRKHDFGVVVQYMKECGVISWMEEIHLLIAAKYKLQISSVGLTRSAAEELYMCLSYLVYIDDNNVPVLYFPSSDDEDIFLQKRIQEIWKNNCSTPSGVVSSESVMGLYFEAQVPSAISNKIEIKVKKLLFEGEPSSKDFNIVVDCTYKNLDTLGNGLPSKNVLWRTPKSFKAIDFFAEIDGLDLPDCNENQGSTLIAIQATVQATKLSEKIRKSITGVDEHISRGKNVIFVLINPYWTDFDTNYLAAVNATSGVRNQRFNSYWYGHPSDFSKFKTLLRSLQLIFA